MRKAKLRRDDQAVTQPRSGRVRGALSGLPQPTRPGRAFFLRNHRMSGRLYWLAGTAVRLWRGGPVQRGNSGYELCY
jgi:hypothetical protein